MTPESKIKTRRNDGYNLMVGARINRWMFECCIPFVISMKVAAYIFYNYPLISDSLNLTACFFAVYGLTYLIDGRKKATCGGRLNVAVLLVAIAIVHAILITENLNVFLMFFTSVIVAAVFFIHIEFESTDIVRRSMVMSGYWMLLKVIIYFIPFLLVWFGDVPVSDEFVKFMLGIDIDGAPLEVLGGRPRFMDKSIVLFPLALYAIRDLNKILRLPVWFAFIFVLIVNFTIAIFVSAATLIFLYLIMNNKNKTTVILALLLFQAAYVLIGSDAWIVFLDEKYISTSIKAAQFKGTIDALGNNILGSGIGNLNAALFRPGDVVFENSYLFILYSYGILSIPLLVLIGWFFVRSIFVCLKSRNDFPAAATAITIIISSGSNPYLFAGSIYVVLYAISRIYQAHFKQWRYCIH